MRDNDKVTLTFGQLKKLVKESYNDIAKQKLEFFDQIKFKDWAASYGINVENNADFYFDNIYCVDAIHGDKTIPGVKCNGTMTWGQALKKLQEYFKVAGSARNELDYDGYVWEINEYRRHGFSIPKRYFVKESEDIFDTPEEAFEDGIDVLNSCPNKGYFQMVVMLNGAEYRYENFIGKAAIKNDGDITISKSDNPSADKRFIKTRRKW